MGGKGRGPQDPKELRALRVMLCKLFDSCVYDCPLCHRNPAVTDWRVYGLVVRPWNTSPELPAVNAGSAWELVVLLCLRLRMFVLLVVLLCTAPGHCRSDLCGEEHACHLRQQGDLESGILSQLWLQKTCLMKRMLKGGEG